MSNPILEGIMAGAGLAQRSANARQRRYEFNVGADQFQQQQKLQQDMFDEDNRRTKRNENMQAAQAWRSRLHSMKKEYDAAPDDKKEAYGRQVLAHFNNGLQNNAYVKEILGAGFEKATGRPMKELDTGNELDTLTAGAFDEKTGKPLVAITNKQGGYAAHPDENGNVVADNKGVPLTMTVDDVMGLMDGSFNDAFKAGNVELDRQDKRVDSLSKGLQSFDDNYVQANAGVRDTWSAWGAHRASKPGLGGGASPAVDAKPMTQEQSAANIKRNVALDVLDQELKAVREEIETASKTPSRLRSLHVSDRGFRAGSDIEKQREMEKNNNSQHTKLLAKEKEILAKQKALTENPEVVEKVTKGQVAPEDVKDKKAAEAAWIAKDKQLELAYNNARTAADKAEVARSRAHIAAMQKMGIKMDAGDISSIMNHQDANYHYNMRNKMLAQRNSQKARAELNKIRDANRKAVIDHYKFLNSNIKTDYRSGGWPEKALGAIKKSQIMNNPYTDFTEDDAAAVDPMFKKLAPYTDDLSYDTAIIATDLTSGGFLKGLEGEDFYNRVDEFATSFQSISDRINEDPRGKSSGRSVAAHIMQKVKTAKADPKNKGVSDVRLMVNAINAYNG